MLGWANDLTSRREKQIVGWRTGETGATQGAHGILAVERPTETSVDRGREGTVPQRSRTHPRGAQTSSYRYWSWQASHLCTKGGSMRRGIALFLPSLRGPTHPSSGGKDFATWDDRRRTCTAR